MGARPGDQGVQDAAPAFSESQRAFRHDRRERFEERDQLRRVHGDLAVASLAVLGKLPARPARREDEDPDQDQDDEKEEGAQTAEEKRLVEEGRIACQAGKHDFFALPSRISGGRCRLRPLVRLLKDASGPIDVPWPLLEGLRIPFASRNPEEVAAIDVQAPGVCLERIGHGVNGVFAQKKSVPRLDILASGGFQSRPGAAKEIIVLPAAVEADDRPHAVVVRIEGHAWRPDDIQDGQLSRTVEHLDARLARLPESRHDFVRIRDGAPDDLPDRLLGHAILESRAAVFDESLELEHVCLSCVTARDLSRGHERPSVLNPFRALAGIRC